MRKIVFILLALGFASPGAFAATEDAVHSQADRIHDRILREARGGQGIIVQETSGWVTLRGMVSSESEKIHAEEIANQSPGVKAVDNKIIVR